MNRIILSCLVCCIAIDVFAQKPKDSSRYAVMVQEVHPICLLDYTYMITTDCDLYYKAESFYSSPQIYHTKITEEQYSSVFSEDRMKQWQNVYANDSIVYNGCNGVDDSSFAIIMIRINGFTISHIGRCTFPSGFDDLFAFLHNYKPRFSRFTGKLTHKSSKQWTQVQEMPDLH